ncbi:hypothetical protein ACFR9U_15220 [Halorientalis brevis]|uniref:Tat (Twin-arginine translocation) pathway signal sequence n=1 Tax=Halorientalis brevis TaxID=1126241 RepID=A0ABD6CF60_9EURY|nr:hypothetical protein [Halorientalis brevis]
MEPEKDDTTPEKEPSNRPNSHRGEQPEEETDAVADDSTETSCSSADSRRETRSKSDIDRRSILKATGAAAAVSSVGAVSSIGLASAAVEVTQESDYEVWTVTGKEVYDLSDGEQLSNVLIDQTADGACLTIRSRNKTGWEVSNVGFVGVGQVGDGSNRFQFQVSVPAGGHGLIENIWANGKARDGQPSTELGGVYVRSSHAGHIDVKHTYIEGFGNNAVYASAVGKDGGSDGSVAIENSFHRDNTVSQFRIGSPDSYVRNCVGIINDPNGERGVYPGTTNNRNARGIWGKHYRNQRVENCSFYVSPDDVNPDGVFEARYISGRSHGPEAEVDVVDCDANADAPTLTGSTSNANVNLESIENSPTVDVIGGGGVPTSPEMAARGEREMPNPPELSASDGGSDGSTDTSTLDRTLTIDGSDADWTEYEFTVSGTVENNADVGSFDGDDQIDGSTVSGFVNGGVDGYRFAGEVTDATVDGNATVLVDGQAVDPDGITSDRTLTIDGSDAGWTDYEFTVSGDLAENPDVGGLGSGDQIDGSTATGFVNGGVDSYLFSGEITDATVDGNATILVDEQPLDLGQFESAPAIVRYDVVEVGSPNPDANIVVEWGVTDADGDLATVTVEIVDENGSVVAESTTSVAGTEAYDVDYFAIEDVDDQRFTVRLTVTDAFGTESATSESIQE